MSDSANGSSSYMAIVKASRDNPRAIPTTPTMQKVNFSEDSLQTNIKTKTSNHINDSGMVIDVNRTGVSIEGGYSFEYQFNNSGESDQVLLALMGQEDWSDIHSVAGPVDVSGGAVVASGSLLQLATAATIPDNIVDGQTVRLAGCANAANNGFYVLTATANANEYTTVPALSIDETLPATATVDGQMARNGRYYQPFFIERGHTDISEYLQFMGMAANMLKLEMKDQSDVTGSYEFIGLDSGIVSAPVGSSYTDQPLTPVFSTSIDIREILIDGVIQETCLVKDMDMEISRGITPKTGLGVFGACSTNMKTLQITGKLTMFFEDSTMLDNLKNGTAFSVAWTFLDTLGNGYRFTLPRVKLSEDKNNVSGSEDDVMDEASYVATRHPATNCAIQIDRFTALS